MTQHKQILLAPRLTKEKGIYRAASTTALSDFFLDRSFLPIMSFFDTKFKHKEESLDLARKYLENSQALVLQGGNDICPFLYNQENQKAVDIAQFRDVFELALIEIAIQKEIPILGICRGMQLINIAFGGTLFQDLDQSLWQKHEVLNPATVCDAETKLPKAHIVIIEPKSTIYQWLNLSDLKVNSWHHQGIDKLGNGLEVEARSGDGLIEAISTQNGQILGMQWHPELDLTDPDQVRILDKWLEKV